MNKNDKTLKFWKPQAKQSIVEIPLHIIELEHDNYHILIEGRFPDETLSWWVIDTGASKTVFDKNLTNYFEVCESDNTEDYQSAGINQGMMETTVGKLTGVKFNDLEITNKKVALIDLSHVNEIYEKYTSYKISGLIGGDILMNYSCTISYAKKTLQFQVQENVR